MKIYKLRTLLFFRLVLVATLIFLSVDTFSWDASAPVTHISQEELTQMQAKNENTILIDVRTQGEYGRGHIPGAVNIPHADILSDASLLDLYRSKNIVFYCHSGARVKKVTDFLVNRHYDKELFHLKGDFRAWQARSRP